MKRVAATFLPPVAIDRRAKTPMYRQLYDWFRKSITTGHMRPGQRVLSTRSLAAELKISRIPVVNAYEQLLAEGYFETFTGSGTCVARSIPEDSSAPPVTRGGAGPSKNKFSQEATKTRSRRMSRREIALAQLPSQSWLNIVGPFRASQPALEHFPIGIWSKLVARHARTSAKGVMGYGDAMGYLPLREAISEYLGASRAVRCDASQIMVTTGSQQGLQLCAQVLFDPQDIVWLEEPGYPSARQAFIAAGARLLPVPVDHEGMNFADMIRRGRRPRAVYITPSHQYPLGVAMGATRRMLLLNWALRSDAWIIEDDYDSEYRFGSRPISSLQGLDSNDRVIYIGTFSKVMFPALRLGYIVIPKDLVAAFSAARDAADVFSSTLYQLVMADFIREGHFARHIRRMRMLYMERRRVLAEAIEKEMGDACEVIGAEAGMHLVVMLPAGVDDVAVSKRAATRGVSATPLSTCYLGSTPKHGLVLGYGGANERQIRDGVRKLRISVEEHQT
jgi:GntR family transcriptional regulator / MocR family aminotransferase